MQQIKIDFDNPGLPQHLEAMEGDAQSRFFQATLYRSGAAYTPPAGVAYSIMYRGFCEQNQGWYDTIEDDTGKRNACVASGNVVTCEIDRHALIVPGHVSIVLCITNDRGYMLKSRPILTDARNDNYDDTVEVESYFRITGKTSAWWLQNKKDVQDLVNKATTEATKAENSANASATSAAASKRSADDSAASASASSGSAAAAARSESAAAGSATEAAGSASAAENSKTAAATSESNAAKHEEAAKKAADEAGAKAGTDKTLSIENAPADAKATGDALAKKVGKDVILDEDGNVIFYSKAAVDKLLAGKLDSTGGTMAGKLEFFSGTIMGGSILSGEEDAANAPGGPLNNLVIRSWNGVSFTTDSQNQTYTGKTAVCVDCREGIVKAARFEGKIDVNSIYPVGSIYMTVGADPASIFGGTWRLVASERVLMGASNSHKAGSTVNAGLPNITGSAYGDVQQSGNPVFWGGSGAIQTSQDSGGSGIAMYKVADYGNHRSILKFDASKSNGIYGCSGTVQPAAYYVNIWQRVS